MAHHSFFDLKELASVVEQGGACISTLHVLHIALLLYNIFSLAINIATKKNNIFYLT